MGTNQFADDWTPEMERGEDCEPQPAPDTEALVQTVRRGLSSDGPTSRYYQQRIDWARFHEEQEKVNAALDALAHELKRLRVGRDGTAEAYRELEEKLNAADEFKAAMVRANQRQVDEITSLRSELERRSSAADVEHEMLWKKLRTAEAELANLRVSFDTVENDLEVRQREWEAELERVKAERDEAVNGIIAQAAKRQDIELIEVQARLDKALAALREIAEGRVSSVYGARLHAARARARAAIAEIEGEADVSR